MTSSPFPTTPALVDGVVHVLCARLDRPPLPIDELRAITSADEIGRAARFIHDADRHRHIIARGLLRLALAPIVQAPPADLEIHTTDLGKPFLHNGPSFNISHSGNTIAIALAAEGRLGIDVEAVRDLRDLLGLARTSFAYDELCTVATLPAAARVRPFFRVWTRKEAILKALGLGLSALDAISVSADDSSDNALLRLSAAGEDAFRWTVQSLDCGPDVEAAVAWDRPIRSVALAFL